MDGQRFDRITRALASGASRRRILQGLAGGIAGGLAAAVGRRDPAEAQVTQAQCGNKACRRNPGKCAETGCVCCVYGNNNSRCVPPGSCTNGTETCPNGEPVCGAEGCCPEGQFCLGGFACSLGNGTGTEFSAPPEAVWHALTDAETLTSLGIPSDIAPRVGHRFQLRSTPRAEFEGVMEAEMVEVEAPRRFAFQWLNGPLDEPTTVTLHIDPIADGTMTRVRLAHTDASGESCRAGAQILGRDWGRKLFKDALPRHLAQGRQR